MPVEGEFRSKNNHHMTPARAGFPDSLYDISVLFLLRFPGALASLRVADTIHTSAGGIGGVPRERWPRHADR